tara:strand:- start:1095 stop:1850 length:756 start_codon:yes stop_codon:yes gene_type:complete
MKITKKQLRIIVNEEINLLEKNKKGLWDNIHAKRSRGETPAKKGDKDYPSEEDWDSAQEVDESCDKKLYEYYSEGMTYHLKHGVGVDKNIHRPGSSAFFSLFREARLLSDIGLYSLNESEAYLLDSSDLGEFGYYEGKKVPLDYPMLYEEELDEAEYKGKKVELNKPKRGSPKAYVYVNSGKKDKKGRIKVKKVSFGSSMPVAMGDSEAHRKRRKSFGDRHNCSDKKDKTAPGYWSCRATKFFGRSISGWW